MRRRIHPLAEARIAASSLFAALFALAFLGPAAATGGLFGLVAGTQLFPAAARLLAGGALASAACALALATSTLVFGRLYCSLLCPLGAAQDAAFALGRRLREPRLGYARGPGLLRAASFAAAALALVLGAAPAASFLDPYSFSGRFLEYALRPAAEALAGLLSPAARLLGLYWAEGGHGVALGAALAAALPFILVLGAAFAKGRLFCGGLCPVGSLLGLLNRAAVMRVRLEPGACVSCGACERICKARCLDAAGKTLNADRCVSCFSCLSVCPTGALAYGPGPRRGAGPGKGGPAPDGKKPEGIGPQEPSPAEPGSMGQWPEEPGQAGLGPSRRSFLKKAASGGAAAALALLPAPLSRAAAPRGSGGEGLEAAAPPGAGSLERFLARCTACGLCVSKCPSKVLRPSVARYGARGFLAPYLDYDGSYCQYECAACLELCPTEALGRMPLGRKKLVQMGTAALVREKCIVVEKRTACGACAEHCPTGAVRMVALGPGLPEPLFDEAICVGCGACRRICPALPDKAITVTGKNPQGLALAPRKDLFAAEAAPGGKDGAEQKGDGSEGAGGTQAEAGAGAEEFPF